MKKTNNKFFAAVFLTLCFSTLLAKTEDHTQKSLQKISPWNFSLVTDLAYYFKSAPIPGKTHFAPVTGPFDGIAFRTLFNSEYRIPTPLGEHWLVNNAAVGLNMGFELSPVTAKPITFVSFEPVPFLVLSAGFSAGTGWSLLGFDGLAVAREDKKVESLPPFKNWAIDFWGKALLQFDTGAIWEGDWTHLIFQGSVKIGYNFMPGLSKDSLWFWQISLDVPYCRGWRIESNIILAYQLPFVLDMVGIMIDIAGQIKASDYGEVYKNYAGNFIGIDISPLIRIKFRKQDLLYIAARFKSRRSFEQKYSNMHETPSLDYAGREWFFDRIAFSWTHLF